MQYNKINNITGWIAFIIATTTYTLTVEMTASFWDVGEFVAVSYKLMVPHPPGAPFFLLLGRMFSFLAMGDVERVAFWINMLSVIASGFTVLFLFWSITLMAKKMLNVVMGEETITQIITIMGAGFIGSLAYTFTDTAWFSAVEGEVYAMSSFLIAIVLWAMLKWELIDDESRANRWLILIAYIFGLSIGVHLLNLVAIPALGLIYYFKKYPTVTRNGIILCMAISGLIIIIINNGVIPGLPSFAGSLEVFFVNNLGLPFGSGIIFLIITLVGSVAYGIYYSQVNQKVMLNTALISFAFILIGYSSYSLVVIRSAYNPPIDENNPESIMSVVSYLKREQYGTRPLLHGQYFTAELQDQKKGAPVYVKGEDKYEVADHKIVNIYDPKQTTILPRAWSSGHAAKYQEIMGLRPGEKPSFIDNLSYMFNRQMAHMYWRYFMWNFSGRSSDIQDASWLSPFDATKDVPDSIAKNRGRNNYFMLPLLLGLVGLFYCYVKSPKQFYVALMLFFLTGLALIIYLNSPPTEPRERDYIYVGSYYAFAIFIGFGVIALTRLLSKYLNSKYAAIVAIVVSLVVPSILVAENWDDHDRSDRYFSVDSAKNFLASCAPNSILFTGGDNDTFPLWYVQEVEGFRTDVRVVVLSYFNTDWYIEQMARSAYESEAFPFSLDLEDYRQGGPNDMLFYNQQSGIKGAINLRQYLKLLKQSHSQLQYQTKFGMNHTIPSKDIYLDIDSVKVMEMGIIPKKYTNRLVNRMQWNLKGNFVEKKDLMIMDLIVSNNWERPIYFNNTSRQGTGLNLTNYLIQEGNAYRLLPITNPVPGSDFVNTDIMYDNLINNFHYRELDNPDVYYNEDYRKFVLNQRASFNTLVGALLNEGNEERAREVALKSLSLMPSEAIPFDITGATMVAQLFALGEQEMAIQMAEKMGNRASEQAGYYLDNNNNIGFEVQQNIMILRDLSQTLNSYGEVELAAKYGDELNGYYQRLQILDSSNR